MVVEASTGARKGGNQKTKIFVGNLHKDSKLEELKSLFEVYGNVVEADILTNYAFVVSVRGAARVSSLERNIYLFFLCITISRKHQELTIFNNYKGLVIGAQETEVLYIVGKCKRLKMTVAGVVWGLWGYGQCVGGCWSVICYNYSPTLYLQYTNTPSHTLSNALCKIEPKGCPHLPRKYKLLTCPASTQTHPGAQETRPL